MRMTGPHYSLRGRVGGVAGTSRRDSSESRPTPSPIGPDGCRTVRVQAGLNCRLHTRPNDGGRFYRGNGTASAGA
jgi:hypothetical protein